MSLAEARGADPTPRATPAEARLTFPALRDIAYLDAAAVSLASEPACAAVTEFLELCMHPRAADASLHHEAMDAMRAQAVPEAARLVGASEGEIALVESTTHGLNIVADCLPLRAGDRILVADTEFPQVALPWLMKQKSVGVEVVPVPSRMGGLLDAEDFAAAMDGRTRAVCVSSVQWCSGVRLDLGGLGELCRSRGVYLVVDAIQELGACPIDVQATPVDFLIAGGHKWLNAPFGCGILYIASHLLTELQPADWGYIAAEPPGGLWSTYFQDPTITPFREWTFVPTAKRFEIAGTANYPGAVGLAASLAQINGIGIEAIHRHILGLTSLLHDELDRLGARVISPREPEEVRSGITVFRYHESRDDDLALLARVLRHSVYVAMRFTSGVGGIRVSTHFYNNEDDVRRLVAALEESI
jgi:cysteine desulfurase/selenocysteine lyase